MSNITEKYKAEDGKIHIVRNQDLTQLLKDTHELREGGAMAGYGDHKAQIGARVPMVFIEQWMKETGLKLGSPEFDAYVTKKVMSGEYSKFKVKGF
tara:strand:- start:117 stop:404 length:288 start_codon:yes stop_codon:yes gene_type:complete